MSALKLQARAKINWTLDILGQRDDGYHLMDMLMQPVTLCDTITLQEADTITLTCGGTPYIAPDEHHLALRAARALAQATGCKRGVHIHVHKRIPAGAGMGGGSADAAGVLWGLNRFWQLGLSGEALEAVGLTLGADVPFCIRGGLTRTRGIGEEMENLPLGRDWPLVVIQPCEGLSTGAVFRAYHAMNDIPRPDTSSAMEALRTGDRDLLAASLANVLQPVSEAMRPEIRQAIDDLLESGAFTALMTGSGSAVFGVFQTAEEAEKAAQRLGAVYDRCFACSTCAESILIEEE